MPSEGYVTVVPVDKTHQTHHKKGENRERGGEWSTRDQSPCTARMKSKSSRRDASPYGVKSIVPKRDPSPIRRQASITRNGSNARRNQSPITQTSQMSKRDSSPATNVQIRRRDSSPSRNVRITKRDRSPVIKVNKRDPSPSTNPVVSKHDPSVATSSRPAKRDSSPSATRQNISSLKSKRDPSPSMRQNVLSKRDPSPSTTRISLDSSKLDQSPSARITVKRVPSKRDASPSVAPGPRRLGGRTSSPNTSNSSIKGLGKTPGIGRADGLRNSNPPSRSSSFNRADHKALPTIRPGLATLPRDAEKRSRSIGDYVTVLEIGTTETRSKSASTRPVKTEDNYDVSTLRKRVSVLSSSKPASRSNSFKKSGSRGSFVESNESVGPVSVLVRQSPDILNSNMVDGRPRRKQSINIGRRDPSPSLSKDIPSRSDSGDRTLEKSTTNTRITSQATGGAASTAEALPAATRDAAVQCLSAENATGEGRDSAFTEQDIDIHRKSGEKLGFGLRFEGGGKASECVKRLFIQCCSPESPAARATCSWGGIVEGDQILSIGGQEIRKLTRLECVKALKGNKSHILKVVTFRLQQIWENVWLQSRCNVCHS